MIERAAARMHEDWQSELDRLVASWDQIAAEQRTELVDQVREAAANNDVQALTELVVSTDKAADLLTAYTVSMAMIGANEVVTEASEQGEEVDPAVPSESDLGALALIVVTLLAAGLALVVGREALRLLTPESSPDEIARQIDEYLRSLSDRALRDQLGGALTNARNKARFATMLRARSAAWYASERNDPHGCDPCRNIDDYRFDSLAEAFLAYPNGGYRDCLGGVRCRGGVIPIWEREG